MSKRPRLVLIDGSSYLYRAYHALPPLTNAAGEPTGALFGVVNMLRAIIQEQPEYVAFVADASGPTFRDELYPDYKANREAMPDELRSQIEPLFNIVRALGFPILRVEGVEADDVIGTLSHQAAEAGIDVTISSGDKDFVQLIRPGVELVNTMTGQVLDVDGVIERYDVRPEQFIDYLALIGDKIDNIPGVDKCGPKTAARWLAEHGDLDTVIANAGSVRGKIGEYLRAALEHLPLFRKLVTIRTDLELGHGPADLAFGERDVEALRELYTRYGFNAALKELDGNGAEGSPQASVPAAAAPATPAEDVPAELVGPGDYELILDEEDFQRWLDLLKTAPLIAFDVETDSLDSLRARLVGISFAVEPRKAAYVPLAHDGPDAPAQLPMDTVLAALKPLFEDPARPKLAHNAKYDINVLACHGITVQGLAEDTLLESYVLRSTANRHDLDTLAQRHLGYPMLAYTEVAGRGAKQIPFNQVDVETACRYGAEDSDLTLRLHRRLAPQLVATPSLQALYRDMELPLVGVLARMEQHGVLVDSRALRAHGEELGRRMLALTEQAHALAGNTFSLDSPRQLQAILFDQLGLPVVVKTPGGQPSTNEEALEAISDQHELPRVILDYRALAKLRSTYTSKLVEMVNPRTGRVHTCYNQATAATGRLASSDPNLQNIPIRTAEGRRIRQAFVAPDGWRVMAADYSQIELRILAHFSQDPGLLGAFRAGADIHRATAAEMFELELDAVDADQRRAAKTINFGLMYGMSAFGLARALGIGRGEAAEYMARYFSRYPGVQAFMDQVRERAHRDGYVETLFGRRVHVDYINSRNAAQRAGAERAAINAPMQGTAADIIKRAMIEVDGWLAGRQDRARMLMQVHDELVLEVREDALEEIAGGLSAHMIGAAELSVPLLVEVGTGANWDEAH